MKTHCTTHGWQYTLGTQCMECAQMTNEDIADELRTEATSHGPRITELTKLLDRGADELDRLEAGREHYRAEWEKCVNEIDRLSRIEDKYVNLCPVLNEQAGEIERIAQARLTWAMACQCTCDACESFSSVIRKACFQSEASAYQGAVTDSVDVPR